ncbi:MAG: hypothetical protein ACRD2E_05345 [Terriglobales bacterium]
MRFRGATAGIVAALVLWLGGSAWAQGRCPGGDLLTGFRLMVAPAAGGPMLPLTQISDLRAGEMLWYLPNGELPQWRNSARVALLLIPSAEDAENARVLAVHRADRPAAWVVPEPVAAVALMFGPHGFNAKTIHKLAAAHPELIRSFIAYASQATRVEALVALLSRYEQSRPGSLNLQAMLHQYSERYGIKLPKINPAQPPEETATELLHAVAPPTAQEGASPHAALAVDSQSAAAAVASLYFSPVLGVMGVASSSVPLVKALHGMIFPGTAFRGAFAVPGLDEQSGMALCTTNASPQAHARLAYLWIAEVPGDSPPGIHLLGTVSIQAGWPAAVTLTCDRVAQLRAIMRARGWALIREGSHGGQRYPISVEVLNVGVRTDKVRLDLRQAEVPPGRYRLATAWDWTPVVAQGTVQVRPEAQLAHARLAPGAPPLVSGRGAVTYTLTGADFSLVHRAELLPSAGGTAVPVTCLHRGAVGLAVKIDAHHLAAGAYQLRLQSADGQTAELPLRVLPPNPSLAGLPLTVHLGAARPTVWLRGRHLEQILRVSSPGATWTLGRGNNSTSRPATIVPGAGLAVGQLLPARLYLAGRAAPITVPDAIKIAPPLPAIASIEQAPYQGAVALRPGEIPANAMVSFSVVASHAGDDPTFQLACQDAAADRGDLRLQPGETAAAGPGQLESAGSGLYYLALLPGRIGRSGCQLQLTISAPGAGDSAPKLLGRIVQMPVLRRFELSSQLAGPGEYAGALTGMNLQMIAATGWDAAHGVPVTAVPTPADGPPGTQRLSIALPWPPPEPHAPLYIWLRGESTGRETSTHL